MEAMAVLDLRSLYLFDPEPQRIAGITYRKTELIRTYKTVLTEMFVAGYDSWLVTSKKFMVKEHLEAQINFFGGTLSTFNWQDDLSKWQDMYRNIEIHSDCQEESKREHAAYEFKLARILKQWPYNSLDEEGKKLAIFDYSSSTLMMDVCKSLLVLFKATHKIATDRTPVETIEAVVLQVCMGSEKMKRQLEALANTEPSEHVYETQGVLRETLTSMRKSAKIENTQLRPSIAIDNIAAFYWGARMSDPELCNHQYLSWTNTEIKEDIDSTVLDRIRDQCSKITTTAPGAMTRTDFIPRFLVPAVRNSVMVTSIFQVTAKMMEVLKCHAKDPVTVTALQVMRPGGGMAMRVCWWRTSSIRFRMTLLWLLP